MIVCVAKIYWLMCWTSIPTWVLSLYCYTRRVLANAFVGSSSADALRLIRSSKRAAWTGEEVSVCEHIARRYQAGKQS